MSSDGAVNKETPIAHIVRLPEDSPAARLGFSKWASRNRLTVLALILCALVALVDALLGHHVILIGLLIVGPCCALLSGRWIRTALVGVLAIALAIVLGVPDGIWGTFEHLAFLGAVFVVAVVSTCSAAVIEHVITRR